LPGFVTISDEFSIDNLSSGVDAIPMKKNVVIFALGLIVGLFLYSSLQSQKKETNSDAQRETLPAHKEPELHQEDIAISRPSSPPNAASVSVETRTHAPETERPPAPSPSKRILQFDVSEFQLQRMEADLEALQKDVSLSRLEKGWQVKFRDDKNLLAEMGLRDGDLIQFSHLESMRRNPETTDLARRLEYVLTFLER
jgi:hypothetical protein